MIPAATVVIHGLIARVVEAGDGDAGLVSLREDLHVSWGGDDGKQIETEHGRLSVDGVAIVDGRLVRTGADAAALWGGEPLGDFAHWWGDHATQSACLYVWDATRREFAILPDPLGGASVFVHQAAGLTFVSTDYRALIETMGKLGLAPAKDPDYQVERLLLGNGGLRHTSHVGGRRLPVFAGIVITDQGLDEVTYRSHAVLLEPQPYLTSLNRLRDDVVAAVSAVASAPADFRISHLTGGFDSRLVLGAILEAGVQDAFAFFCSGAPPSDDRLIADGLTRTFRLNRTLYSGQRAETVGTHPEQQRALLGYAGGLSVVGPTGAETPVSVVSAGGGYGEVMRSFHVALEPWGNAPWVDGVALLKSMVGTNVETLVSADAINALGARLSNTLTGIQQQGVPQDFVPDVLYTEVRNRYHMGATTLAWSRVGSRVNPLYSVHALAAARQVALLARRANVVGFDLMESFPGQLSRYPFDKPRSTPEYRRQRRGRTGLAFADGPLTWVDGPSGPAPAAYIRGPGAIDQERALERAKALGVIQWQSAFLEDTQAALRASLESSDLGPLEQTFAVGYLRDLATTDQWNRARVRHLYAATSIVQWFLGDDA